MSLSKKPKTINPDEVDPSVYYYDEVYDDMKNEERPNDRQSNKAKPSGSKYIKNLIETAEQRKSEKEIRKFKKYARDREEAERDSHGGEVYITSSYKKKLEEMKKLEDEKRKRIRMEQDRTMNIFTKHKDGTSGTDRPSSTSKHSKPSSDDPKSEIGTRPEPTAELDESKSTEKSNKPKRMQLKTIEERRQYLREILAKRTVGKIYQDAVEKYKQRKRALKLT